MSFQFWGVNHWIDFFVRLRYFLFSLDGLNASSRLNESSSVFLPFPIGWWFHASIFNVWICSCAWLVDFVPFSALRFWKRHCLKGICGFSKMSKNLVVDSLTCCFFDATWLYSEHYQLLEISCGNLSWYLEIRKNKCFAPCLVWYEMVHAGTVSCEKSLPRACPFRGLWSSRAHQLVQIQLTSRGGFVHTASCPRLGGVLSMATPKFIFVRKKFTDWKQGNNTVNFWNPCLRRFFLRDSAWSGVFRLRSQESLSLSWLVAGFDVLMVDVIWRTLLNPPKERLVHSSVHVVWSFI